MGIGSKQILGVIAGAAAILMFVQQPFAQEGALRVAVSHTVPSGANPGFDADLMAIIADQAGLKVAIRIMSAEDILPALVAGEIDIAIEVAERPGNQPPGVEYTQTAVLNTGVFAIATDSSIKVRSLSDLQDLVVGATTNTTWYQQLIEGGLTEIRTYPNYDAAMAALIAGDIDVYYTSRAVILYRQYANGLDCGARVIDDYVSTNFPLARLAVRSADTELLAVLNRALSEMRSLGILFGGGFHYHPDEVNIAPLCQVR